ncbi:MAG: L,D-transpeptidase family protein [Ilumatobacteraceae bacterium]
MKPRRGLPGPATILIPLFVVACSAADAEAPSTVAVTEPSVAATSTTTSTSSTTSSTTSTTTTTTLPPTTTTTLAVPALAAPLEASGARNGEGTRRVQERLLQAGYWHVAVDGKFGHTTKQAVMAFQKYHGLKASGSVDQATALALTAVSEKPVSRSQLDDVVREGVVVEVDKDRQILMIVVNGSVEWVLNTSTGNGQWYLEQNQKDPTQWELGKSITDSGRFTVNRQRSEGWWEGDLGEIYRPKYFNGGIAIHGSRSIPSYPASHGCVRVSVSAMDMIWESGLVPKGTRVWVYGADPETENEKPEMPTTTTTTTLAPDPESPDMTVAVPESTLAP